MVVVVEEDDDDDDASETRDVTVEIRARVESRLKSRCLVEVSAEPTEIEWMFSR